MVLSIRFRFSGGKRRKTVQLSPEEYFDSDEPANIKEGIPRLNHAIEYLEEMGFETKKIQDTQIFIKEPETENSVIISELFWNNGKNRIIERKDSEKGKRTYWEIIQEIRIKDDPIIVEILRFSRNQKALKILYHGFIKKEGNGAEKEIKIYPEGKRMLTGV